MRSRSPCSNETMRVSSGTAWPSGKKRSIDGFGAPRASSAVNVPSRARAIMRWSRSVPLISTRASGIDSRQTAASVYASAP